MDELYTLPENLPRCHAVKSLLQEMELSATMKKYDWHVTDSPFYEDSNSGKFRELDIFGRKYYSCNEVAYCFDIQLLVESKSIEGYHVVLSNKDRFYSCDLDTIRIDSEIEKGGKFKSFLQGFQFSDNDILDLLNRMREEYYPKDSWVFSKYSIPFFQMLDCFYSFRETNIGGEKELSNSVIWKTSQELLSANEYIRNRQINNFYADIEYSLTKENKVKDNDNKMIPYSAMQRYLDQLDLIYPIVVVNCPIWELFHDGKMQSKPYARLMQTDLYGVSTFWIDIVNKSHFSHYMEALTNHIEKYSKSLNARLGF